MNFVSRSPWRRGVPVALLALALGLFALSPAAQAVTPAPDGGYPNENTAEGTDALLNLPMNNVIGGNTAIGFEALKSDTTGVQNTAVGDVALQSNTTGNFNTGVGLAALAANQTGDANTAIGWAALSDNTHGNDNTAIGTSALFSNTTGSGNTAVGEVALQNNISGNDNTATGFRALDNNTTGPNNTANGVNALRNNTSGSSNTANGKSALLNNAGNFNTANGANTLQNNQTGSSNTANGVNALFHNTTGGNNTANGVNALDKNTSGSSNTANGVNALFNNTTGVSNIALGFQAGFNLTTGDSNIDIGNKGVVDEANTIRIGVQGTQTKTFVAGISGSPISGTSVVVNSNGRLGTAASSQRFKDDIKPMDKASEAIHALKPVTFHYKKEVDPDGIPQFGLVAEQVEKVNPDLVARDEEGKVYTVRYEAVNAMLLNEFLKEHCKVQEQGATIAQMKKQIEALTATVQKVSDQLEMNRTAPQLVANDQ